MNNILETKVKQRTQELENKLYIDDLTGLKNRFKLDIDIKDVEFPILILIDIDTFHAINELYGTYTGDEVLNNFTSLLKTYAQTRKYEVYRISGDQFVLFKAKEYSDLNKIQKDINELFELVATANFSLEESNDTIELTITAGIVVEQEKVLSKADMALCYAKSNNKKFSFYNLDIDRSKEIADSIKWLRILKKGIKYNLFIPYFQPIVNQEQKIIKYEVLLRLVSKDDFIDETISPENFLPIALKTKQYDTISYMVIKKAFSLLNKKRIDISINLTYRDIKNKRLLQFFRRIFNNKNFAKYIIFEIVESENINDFEILVNFIKEFRTLGVRIAIDDFGSGYSNFTYILKIKPDYLKIDGSLIKDINTNKDSFKLVKAIVQFSKELNIKTIAEYINCEEVFDIVSKLGVDEFQGYYIAKPLKLYQ